MTAREHEQRESLQQTLNKEVGDGFQTRVWVRHWWQLGLMPDAWAPPPCQQTNVSYGKSTSSSVPFVDVLRREVLNPTETTHVRKQVLVLKLGHGLLSSNPRRTGRPGGTRGHALGVASLPEGWGAVITASKGSACSEGGGGQLVAMRTQLSKAQKQQEGL